MIITYYNQSFLLCTINFFILLHSLFGFIFTHDFNPFYFSLYIFLGMVCILCMIILFYFLYTYVTFNKPKAKRIQKQKGFYLCVVVVMLFCRRRNCYCCWCALWVCVGVCFELTDVYWSCWKKKNKDFVHLV